MQVSVSIQMRYGQIVILSILSLVRTSIGLNIARPSSIVPSTIASQYPKLENVSTFGVPEPPFPFHVTYEIGGSPLRKTSCLLNTVNTLKQLALGDWEARISDGTEFRMNNYPEVSILVNTPRRKRSIEAKYIIWAIFYGVHEMIEEKKFELAQFEMSWDSDVFGWVHIINNPTALGITVGGSQANGTLDMAKRSILFPPTNATEMDGFNVTNVVTTDATDDPAEARLVTTFTPVGQNLGVYDVFFPIMHTLTDMAKIPTTTISEGVVAGADGYNGVVCILPAIPIRTDPPTLEYQWLIRTMARIPIYMVENHRFGEIDIKVAVDGVEIAFGRLTNTKCILPQMGEKR